MLNTNGTMYLSLEEKSKIATCIEDELPEVATELKKPDAVVSIASGDIYNRHDTIKLIAREIVLKGDDGRTIDEHGRIKRAFTSGNFNLVFAFYRSALPEDTRTLMVMAIEAKYGESAKDIAVEKILNGFTLRKEKSMWVVTDNGSERKIRTLSEV